MGKSRVKTEKENTENLIKEEDLTKILSKEGQMVVEYHDSIVDENERLKKENASLAEQILKQGQIIDDLYKANDKLQAMYDGLLRVQTVVGKRWKKTCICAAKLEDKNRKLKKKIKKLKKGTK